jgi:hypothetical protein
VRPSLTQQLFHLGLAVAHGEAQRRGTVVAFGVDVRLYLPANLLESAFRPVFPPGSWKNSATGQLQAIC